MNDYIDISSKLNIKKEQNFIVGANAVKNSLHNILSTEVGSVPGHPEFGVSLGRYLFEQIDPLTAAKLREQIKYAVGRWEPRIDISTIAVSEDSDYNRVLIKLTFTIKGQVDSGDLEYIYTMTK